MARPTPKRALPARRPYPFSVARLLALVLQAAREQKVAQVRPVVMAEVPVQELVTKTALMMIRSEKMAMMNSTKKT